MALTYEPIATTTLGSASGNITFNSIPSTYTDLRIVLVQTSTSTAGSSPWIRFNGNTGSNYSQTYSSGTGTTATSGNVTNFSGIYIVISGAQTTAPTLSLIDVFSYAGSTNKTLLSRSAEDTNGGGQSAINVGLWRNTSAINSVTIFRNGGNFLAAGTICTIYGIKAA